jgi:hypothetical protein
MEMLLAFSDDVESEKALVILIVVAFSCGKPASTFPENALWRAIEQLATQIAALCGALRRICLYRSAGLVLA